MVNLVEGQKAHLLPEDEFADRSVVQAERMALGRNIQQRLNCSAEDTTVGNNDRLLMSGRSDVVKRSPSAVH